MFHLKGQLMIRLIFASLLALPTLAQASYRPDIALESLETRATVYTAWLQPNPDPQVAGTCDLQIADELVTLQAGKGTGAPQIFACLVEDR